MKIQLKLGQLTIKNIKFKVKVPYKHIFTGSLMIKQSSLLLILLITFFSSTCFAAKVYKWVDENGVVHYGNDPKHAKKGSKVELDINTYDNNVANPVDNTLVMYTKPNCGFCTKARKYLTNNNIPFEERDIEASVTARLDFEKQGGRGTPFFMYKGQSLNGFSVLNFEVFYEGLNK